MSAKVVFRVKQGAESGQEFVFHNHSLCTVGRGYDCDLRFTSPDVSRHHCLLHIDPPAVRIRDLGSLNGTFVNGEVIGRLDLDHPWDEEPKCASLDIDIHGGDEIRVGSAVLEVALPDRGGPIGA